MTNFLCKPHPELKAPDARRPVCPFMPTAMRRNTVHLQIVEDKDLSADRVATLLTEAKAKFHAMEPHTGKEAVYKAVMLIFPGIDPQSAPALIDQIQEQHKEAFVREGMMLGEFHEKNETPGLHNPAFRPLRTPVPALAIRYMVDSDLLFLNDPKYPAAKRVQFLEAFLRQDFNRNAIAAQIALADAKNEMLALGENHEG